jgi:AmmeMemoRadiSam system protein A
MSPRERHDLLQYVRALAQSLLGGGDEPDRPEFLRNIPHSGVFVSFHRGRQLRGCMGRLRATGPFDVALRDVVEASLHDPRFVGQPITPTELEALEIEVSVLGPLRPMDRLDDLVVGRDGVVVTRGARSGCFLPQVATERGWTAETFLSECCRMKAGLDPAAWRDPGTRVELFSAEVIREKDELDGPAAAAQDQTSRP